MKRWETFMRWFSDGDIRFEAWLQYRWKHNIETLEPMTAEQYCEGLRLALKQGYRDDRPWVDAGQRGQGNRAKRRAGWVLFRGRCTHLGDGYDCCCEPRSYYVDSRVLEADLRDGLVEIAEWQERGRTVRHGVYHGY